MKKYLFGLLLLIIALNANSQNRFFTKNGNVSFDATSPNSPETITAVNEKATSVVDVSTGAIEFAVLMKAFSFEKALMQEHFNENYVESDKFPKATFKGSVTNMKEIDLTKEGTFNAHVKGQLTLHGVSKDIESDGIISIKNGAVSGAKAEFKVLLSEYGIVVPSLVKDKLAQEAKINIDVAYEPMKTL